MELVCVSGFSLSFFGVTTYQARHWGCFGLLASPSTILLASCLGLESGPWPLYVQMGERETRRQKRRARARE